jgi:hypothetical protein
MTKKFIIEIEVEERLLDNSDYEGLTLQDAVELEFGWLADIVVTKIDEVQ